MAMRLLTRVRSAEAEHNGRKQAEKALGEAEEALSKGDDAGCRTLLLVAERCLTEAGLSIDDQPRIKGLALRIALDPPHCC
eukprot:723167-Rhodomonas_salina.1